MLASYANKTQVRQIILAGSFTLLHSSQGQETTIRLLTEREFNLLGLFGTNAWPGVPRVKPRIVLMNIDLRGT